MSKLKMTLAALALGLTTLAARPAFCGNYFGPVTEMGVKQCHAESSSFFADAITYIKFGGFYWDISAYDVWMNKTANTRNFYSSPSAMFTTLAQMSMTYGSSLRGGCVNCASHQCPGDPNTYWYLESLTLP